jgi:hypothetical protein
MVEPTLRAARFGIERIEILDADPEHAVLSVAGPRFNDMQQESQDNEVFILMTVGDGPRTAG